MIPQEQIIKILECGSKAPSGENCQPWLVRIILDGIELFNDPSKDESLYNFGQRGSMVALGAFLENTLIAARTFGFEYQVNLFPDPQNLNFVARVIYKPSPAAADALYDSISRRT